MIFPAFKTSLLSTIIILILRSTSPASRIDKTSLKKIAKSVTVIENDSLPKDNQAKDKQDILRQLKNRNPKDNSGFNKRMQKLVNSEVPSSFNSLHESEIATKLTRTKHFIDEIAYFDNLQQTSFEIQPLFQCNLSSPKFTHNSKTLSKFNLLHFSKIKNLKNLFVKFLNSFAKALPENIAGLNHEFLSASRTLITNNILEGTKLLKYQFNNFRNTFIAETQGMEAEVARLECGVKDLMTFYESLPRFYYVYKKSLSSGVAPIILAEITDKRDEWALTVNKMMKEYSELKVWVHLFSDFFFYAEKDQKKEQLIEFYMYLVKSKSNFQSIGQELMIVNGSLKLTEKKVRNLIRLLEKQNSTPVAGFKDHSDYYVMGAGISEVMIVSLVYLIFG